MKFQQYGLFGSACALAVAAAAAESQPQSSRAPMPHHSLYWCSMNDDAVKNMRRSRSAARGTILRQRRKMRSSTAFISTGICNCNSQTSIKCRRPLLASAKNSNESANGNDSSRYSTTKRQKRYTISTQINDYTKQQLSNIFGSGGSNNSAGTNFVPLTMAGRWSQASEDNPSGSASSSIETILLSSPEQCETIAGAYEQHLKSRENKESNEEDLDRTKIITLPIPLSPSISSNAVPLLTQTYANTPLSKSVLLSLNSLFINRDGGLFDNLPWSTWSVDPNLDERDAADNVVDAKFTMGKRVAYQRFMGKDWQGRSLSLGNLANRVKYMLERSEEAREDDSDAAINNEMERLNDEDMMLSLSQRLLELEIKESQMVIAECEQRLAISKTQSTEEDNIMESSSDGMVEEAAQELEGARQRLEAAESAFQELTNAMQSESEEGESTSLFSFAFPWGGNDKMKDTGSASTQQQQQKRKKTQSLLISILDKFAEQENPPPYRGAIGYPAKLDTKKEMFEDSILPYSSPYELLIDIIDEQLNSEVMGCVLEPTSLLEGNLVLGGALLLKRKGVQKSTSLSGEVVYYTDDDDDLGNEGVLPRSMYVAECFSDEALGMAMASNVPIFVEEEICSRAGSVPVKLDSEKAVQIKEEYSGEDGAVKDMDTLSFANRVPPIRPLDDSAFSAQLEGERVSSERDSNLVRIPLTTNPQLFDGPNQVPQSSSSSGGSVFSTFNPVESLDEYDSLTDDAKARLLLKLESFTGYLPRPRAVRASTMNAGSDYDSGAPPSLLDNILLPLIDESVRRQYQIRDAEQRKDFEEANRLRSEVSPRQVALESAQKAREEGLDEEAARLEEEAELYKILRADVTQDEGAYSRYLDRDDWYERETQARIKRLDKSKFGTLLDGIDLP
mmetsp:Transcript_33614/g.70682  ORF Transcript_33614/g.70682 Transcript_33614/m.70682 type:complete len:904 (-) Transcript_33614:36-2747(-)